MVIKPPGGSMGGSFSMPSRSGGLVPQVQDQWGRSPSHPDYGRPPGDGTPPLGGFQPAPMDTPPGEMPSYTAGQPQGQPQMPAPSGMPGTLPPTWGTVGTQPGQMTVRTAPQGGGMSLYGLGQPGGQPASWLTPPQGQQMAGPWNPFQGRLAGLVRS